MRILAAALLLAVGCSGAKRVMLPSGRHGFYVKCRKSEDRCFLRAEKVCPHGYRVIERREHDPDAGPIWQRGFNGSILIACNGPDFDE